MGKLGLNEIRTKFLDFFESNDHTRLESYSLIPEKDKSLLLINAGMAPLKEYFMGVKKMPNNRATSSQRCVRTQDIENVGKTDRHATFFEMLGNFSFGNYFKREAIHWAVEFLTGELEIDKNLLWATVYLDDDEAYDIWVNEIGLPKERVLRLGKEDNFWELDEGPCGPCSEIFVDRGEKFGSATAPGQIEEDDRFMEVWNLVFTQFNKDKNGNYTKLEHKNIDTGMGLERITLVMEEKNNIFELDAFNPLIDSIEKLSGKKYGENDKDDEAFRVILDHTKTMMFLVYDGVIPSNEQRGYVLRKLIRRAYRYGKLLGIDNEFLSKTTSVAIDIYKGEYPKLVDAKDRIIKIIENEEAKFQETIEQGLEILDNLIESMKAKGESVLDGKSAFKLYDTYGFPIDLTREILTENGFSVDEEGFTLEMENQKEKSRRGSNIGEGWEENEHLDLSNIEKTNFEGYEKFESLGNITHIFIDNKEVNEISSGEEGIVILNKTPFYGESGGQVGDSGYFLNGDNKARVMDTHKTSGDVYYHYIKVEEGTFSVNDDIETKIDVLRRRDIMRNHSATHLLHKALKEVLGDHVNQAGSLVDEHRLRFDFSHFEQISKNDLRKIEERVNEKIREELPVKKIVTDLDKADQYGAIGLFEDKYKDVVRIIQMGDYSSELCGGTHIDNTSEILMFKIYSESGIAAGVRRIEAWTGREVYNHLLSLEDEITTYQKQLKVNRNNIGHGIEQLINENKEKDEEIKRFENETRKNIVSSLESEFSDIKGINVLVKEFSDIEMEQLRELSENISNKVSDHVIVLSSVIGEKVLFTADVSDSLTKKGLNAGQIVRNVAQITGGNGGGRPDFASAGGKDKDKIQEALGSVEDFVMKNYKG